MKTLLFILITVIPFVNLYCQDNEPQQGVINKAEVVLKGLEEEEIEKIFITQLQNRVNLNDRQAEKIRAIYIDFKKRLVKMKAERDIQRIELEEVLTSAEPDFDYIKMKLKELARMNENIINARVEVMQKIFELLTAQQRQFLRTITGSPKSKEE